MRVPPPGEWIPSPPRPGFYHLPIITNNGALAVGRSRFFCRPLSATTAYNRRQRPSGPIALFFARDVGVRFASLTTRNGQSGPRTAPGEEELMKGFIAAAG